MNTKTKTLNDGLIEAIREKIPHDVNLANVLMDTLYMGKEAAYRRLRGDVPFSFEEASDISRTLGISLDAVSCSQTETNALFGLNFINHKNPVETYLAQNEKLIRIFNTVKNDPTVVWYTASNMIPQVFYLGYDYLSKFLLFKWMYQHVKINDVRRFADLNISKTLRDVQKEYMKVSKAVSMTCFIWDNMMFYHLLNDIHYFAKINLVVKEDIKHLKKDLYALLDELEEIAVKGKHTNGQKVDIFVSNIDIDSTYSYLEARGFKVTFLRVYSINIVSTMDSDVFIHQKDWIQSLKRYSTLISESGEMQRIEFFARQRQYVQDLL